MESLEGMEGRVGKPPPLLLGPLTPPPPPPPTLPDILVLKVTYYN